MENKDYIIYHRDLKTEISYGWHCVSQYEREKKFHLNPDSHDYGAVLVRTKKVKSGVCINLNIYKSIVRKPYFYLKHFPITIHFLFFFISLNFNYDEVFGSVVMDHLKEFNDNKQNNTQNSL